MRHYLLFAAAVAGAVPAQAGISLIAVGSLSGTQDRSGLIGTLENGVAKNVLGGMGSGLAYAGGNTFLALPDRGPNAAVYNPLVDNTTSYISRFHTVTMQLTASSNGALPFALTPTLTGTTLLSSATPLIYGTGAGLGLGSGAPGENGAGRYYFTGRSDNFGGSTSTNPANGRFDPEGIRVAPDGRSVYVSDEYGPYVRQFDRQSGQLIRTFDMPANLAIANQAATEKAELGGANTAGRTTNKGMEGLAITPDGGMLVGAMQAALIQDAADPASKKLLRLVTIDTKTGATRQYGYKLGDGSGVSEIVAVNDHQFLVLERDGKGLGDGSKAKVKQIFMVDLAGAEDISGLTGAAAAAKAVGKSAAPTLDIVAALKAYGVPADQIPAKMEGLAFGQDVTLNGEVLHTLWLANDNDFLPAEAGGNNFYVFGFKNGDLPGFVPQTLAAVPEPSTWGVMLLGFGALGVGMRGRRAPVVA